jgi:hypothetical protein
MLFAGYQFEWKTSTKRVGFSAALASGATGILFAIFQVQGWKVPKPLALALIALMLLIIAGAVLFILFDVALNISAFFEHRATSVPWVPSEPPGLLDYEADGLRATDRLNREFEKLAKDTGTVGKKMERASKKAARVQSKSGHAKQRYANRTARGIDRSAVYIEKRLAMLKKLVKEVERNNQGLIAVVPLETEEGYQSGIAFRNSLEGTRTASLESMSSVAQYRESVETFEAQNLSRSLRIASDRLGKALGGVVATLKHYERVAAGLVRDLDQRLAQKKP